MIYDVAGPVEAYRWWRPVWLGNDVSLVSASFKFVWRREVTAEPCCSMGKQYIYGPRVLGPCNGPPCDPQIFPLGGRIAQGCGIYALKSLSEARLCLDGGGVLGKVLLAGKMWPNQLGYRSEKAKIVGLYSPSAFERYEKYFADKALPKMRGSVEKIAEQYDVPTLTPTPADHAELLLAAETHFVTRLCVGASPWSFL